MEFVQTHAANSHGMFRRFRKQFVDVRFSVRNPLLPLRKDDPMNVRWRVHHLGGYMAGGFYNEIFNSNSCCMLHAQFFFVFIEKGHPCHKFGIRNEVDFLCFTR